MKKGLFMILLCSMFIFLSNLLKADDTKYAKLGARNGIIYFKAGFVGYGTYERKYATDYESEYYSESTSRSGSTTTYTKSRTRYLAEDYENDMANFPSFLLSLEILPISYIGIDMHSGLKGHQTEGTKNSLETDKKTWGHVAINFGGGLKIHPIKEFFLDPYVGVGFEYSRYYHSWSQGIASSGTGYSVSGGCNIFLVSRFFLGLDLTYSSINYPETIVSDTGDTKTTYYEFDIHDTTLRANIGFAM